MTPYYLMKAAEDFTGSGGGYVDIHDVTTQWGVFAPCRAEGARRAEGPGQDSDPATVLGNKRFPWLSDAQHRAGHVPRPRDPRGLTRGEFGLGEFFAPTPIEMQSYLWDQPDAGGRKRTG